MYNKSDYIMIARFHFGVQTTKDTVFYLFNLLPVGINPDMFGAKSNCFVNAPLVHQYGYLIQVL